MSWSMHIETADVDGNTFTIDVVEGMTYNLTPMWRKAIPWLEVTKDFDGKRCGDILGYLWNGWHDILAHPSEYRALEPDNGWGDFKGFCEVYDKLLDEVQKHPSGTLRWYG